MSSEWRAESEAPEGVWVIARTVKDDNKLGRPLQEGEALYSDEKQAVKIGGIWWASSTCNGQQQLVRTSFRRTHAVQAQGIFFGILWGLGEWVERPDEWLEIPEGVLKQPKVLIFNAKGIVEFQS